jgi:hypothetical protein
MLVDHTCTVLFISDDFDCRIIVSTGLRQNIPGLKIRLRSQNFCDMSINLVRPHTKGMSTSSCKDVVARASKSYRLWHMGVSNIVA